MYYMVLHWRRHLLQICNKTDIAHSYNTLLQFFCQILRISRLKNKKDAFRIVFRRRLSNLIFPYPLLSSHGLLYPRARSLSPTPTVVGSTTTPYIFWKSMAYTEKHGLYNCFMAGSAPVEKIVDVLTPEQISRIESFRETHHSPIELRDIAIVLLGLKMGFRASDVTHLCFSNIDWKRHPRHPLC